MCERESEIEGDGEGRMEGGRRGGGIDFERMKRLQGGGLGRGGGRHGGRGAGGARGQDGHSREELEHLEQAAESQKPEDLDYSDYFSVPPDAPRRVAVTVAPLHRQQRAEGSGPAMRLRGCANACACMRVPVWRARARGYVCVC